MNLTTSVPYPRDLNLLVIVIGIRAVHALKEPSGHVHSHHDANPGVVFVMPNQITGFHNNTSTPVQVGCA